MKFSNIFFLEIFGKMKVNCYIFGNRMNGILDKQFNLHSKEI